MRNLALDILERSVEHDRKIALRHKRGDTWREFTYSDFADHMEKLAAGLVGKGIKPGQRVGIFSPNLPEWLMVDLAVQSIGAVTVPIFATNGPAQVAGIVNDSRLELLFVGGAAEWETAREAQVSCPNLHEIVLLDETADVPKPSAPHMAEYMDSSPSDEILLDMAQRRASARAEDLATLIYTSGTTGEPKGVQLCHANFTNQFESLDQRFEVGPSDHSLGFLPLSHVYERTWSYYLLRMGAANSVLSNPRHVATAMSEVRPTVMVSAPRLYEKIHSTIISKVDSAPGYRQKLFHWAIGVGLEYWKAHFAGTPAGASLRWKYKLADRLVLKKIRDVMGGPKNFLSAGGAALDTSIEEFFLSVGLLVCQGYGLTETSPMLTCNCPGAFKFGTVGKPIPGVEIKIDEECGEILVKGPNVTSGYFGRPEATYESFTDGWFRTGDVGHLDEEGYVVITDRIKDLIITSGGKNVAPQRIETQVGKDHYIDQLAVVGDKRKFVSAIVVPAFENLVEFAEQKKLQFANRDELIKLPEVVEFYRQRIKDQSRNLAPFEKIKRFTLVAREFSQQAGEITPTLKVRRKVVAEKYHQLIERMYQGEKKDVESP